NRAHPQAQADEVEVLDARRAVEGDRADVRRVPPVPPAEAPAPGVRQLWVLRRSRGPRGRIATASVTPRVGREGRVPRRATPLERALRVRFRDPALLELALTHTSFAAEHDRPEGRPPSGTNQRLEFLGDAVLALVVADV